MPTRWPRIPLATLCCLFALATSASAEGAWVLWEESGDMQTFRRTGTEVPRVYRRPV